jgi:hypothetical protein
MLLLLLLMVPSLLIFSGKLTKRKPTTTSEIIDQC